MKLEDRGYWNPYLAGVGLGLVVLFSFFLFGKGIGASGAFFRLTAWGTNLALPEYVQNNGSFRWYFWNGAHPLNYFLIYMTIGTALGGLVSGILGRRNKVETFMGENSTKKLRLTYAFAGGALSGIGAEFSRGCTSGQGITSAGLMSIGGWIFLFSVFAGAFMLAWFVRREWL